MANGIGKLTKLGIAKQNTFDTAAASPTFILPVTNTPKFEYTINTEEDSVAIGSSYEVDETEQTTRMAEISPEVKIDENVFPLLLTQNYSISTDTVSGETEVYEHTITRLQETQNWFTIFLQDDNRKSYVMKNALIANLEDAIETGFEKVNLQIQGNFPEEDTVSIPATDVLSFVGRHSLLEIADADGTLAAAKTRNVTLTHSWELSGEEFIFAFDDEDMSAHEINTERIEISFEKNQPNMDYFDEYRQDTPKQFRITSENTDRFVDGSVADTNPKIVKTIPYAKYIEYSDREGDLNTQLSENINFLAVDKPSITDTPITYTVINSEDGTDY